MDELHLHLDESLSFEEWVEKASQMYEGDDLSQIEARIDWYVEQLGALDTMDERDAAFARTRIARIEHWLGEQREKRTRKAEWLRSNLEALAESLDFAGKKSRSLPSGTVGYRKKKPTVEVIDKDLAHAWAAQHCPDALKERTTQSVTKTPIVEYVRTTGVHLDPSTSGLRFVDEREDFYITPIKEDDQ